MRTFGNGYYILDGRGFLLFFKGNYIREVYFLGVADYVCLVNVGNVFNYGETLYSLG